MVMAKAKTVYQCSECGYECAKWMGKCPGCGSWNTITEVVEVPSSRPASQARLEPGRLKELKEYPSLEKVRVKTGIGELNRVLGGGIVKGSVVLAGGEPGIGKSTLFLQAADSLCRRGKVLYVSGEESPEQVRLRSERLGLSSQMLFLAETQLEIILAAAETAKPEFLVVDSIQTIYSLSLIHI